MAKTFKFKRCIQFSETDMAGVLHFANYYRIMEEVEHAFWRSLGQSVLVQDGDGHISWPRVACQCEYFAPVRFEDELDITLSVDQLSEKSVSYHIRFECKGKSIAAGKIKAVCCQMGKNGFSSIPIPDALRALLESQV